MAVRMLVLTMIVTVIALGAAGADSAPATGNHGYNSYEGYLSGGHGLNKNFGPGPGYPTYGGGNYPLGMDSDYFRTYIPPEEWGSAGYGTGHLGQGYGPYIFGGHGPTPPGMFDPLPPAYQGSAPPAIKLRNGTISVSVPRNIPGIKCVTVTMVAFNNADLATESISQPPYDFRFPVLDGVKNVRVRIDYVNNGLSATSYPL